MPKPIYIGELKDHVKTKLMEFANSEHRVLRKRARVILLSSDYHTMPEISASLGMSYLTVRLWIQRFLDEGIDGLYTRTDNRGRKETFTEEHKSKVIAAARKPPRECGMRFRTWSVSKLSDYLINSGEVQISRETVRRILHSQSIDWRNPQEQRVVDNDVARNQASLTDDGTPEKGIAFHIDHSGSMTVKEDGEEKWSSEQKASTVAKKKSGTNSTSVIATYDPDKQELVIKVPTRK